MAMSHAVAHLIENNGSSRDWCGHPDAPDFKIPRLPLTRSDESDTPIELAPCGHALAPAFCVPRARGRESCAECDACAITRDCHECGRGLCESCQDYSFAGFVTSDRFVCYRCHPADIIRLHQPRRSPSPLCATPHQSRRATLHARRRSVPRAAPAERTPKTEPRATSHFPSEPRFVPVTAASKKPFGENTPKPWAGKDFKPRRSIPRVLKDHLKSGKEDVAPATAAREKRKRVPTDRLADCSQCIGGYYIR
mmetsp:Transcript_14074/g.41943  ORF Transcript_14074/g.41943 Transcript_14074/m.41943 type:complete len:252 (-) Transcript_14074:31-786(-)